MQLTAKELAPPLGGLLGDLVDAKISIFMFASCRGNEGSRFSLPRLAYNWFGNNYYCAKYNRGPNGELPPPELLLGPNKVCALLMFCGSPGNSFCDYGMSRGAVNNVLCELPYIPPPPEAPLVDKRLPMVWSKDTTSCPGLPVPSNTRLHNTLTSSDGDPYSSDDWFLSCRKPKNIDGIGNIISNIDTKMLPPGIEGVILNFHYFCGNFCFIGHFCVSYFQQVDQTFILAI